MNAYRLRLPSRATPPGASPGASQDAVGVPTEFSMDTTGFVLVCASATRRQPLGDLREVRADSAGVWLEFADGERWHLAHDVFATAAERDAFAATVRSAAHLATPGMASSGRASPLGAFATHLLIGLRATLLLPVRAERVTPSAGQAVLLLATLALANVMGDALLVGRAGVFNPQALPGVLFPLPLFILWAEAGRRLAPGEGVTAARWVMLALCIAPFVELGSLALTSWDALDAWITRGRSNVSSEAWVRAGWLALALAGLWRLRQNVARRFAMGLAGALIVALPLAAIPYDDVLWASRAPEGGTEGTANNAAAVEEGPPQATLDEDFVYRENRLLDQALAALEPPRPGRVNLYLVGFAGASTQNVFMKEIQSVRALFEERFAARGHVITLINNPATLADAPIATHVSLEAALRRIGRMIDPARDIVFLYLTSHGSRDHLLTVDLPPLELTDIAPAELRAVLDAAGIRNRVIVISACYSGGFIAPLQTDSSLIITAARADRSSFGCSNEEDFTYFGRAYFDEALRATPSFIEAYRRAVPIIAAREAAQHYLPSMPQIYEGASIGRVLDGFQKQLDASHSVAGNALNR